MREPELRYALALARAAGEEAVAATRRIVLHNTDPDEPQHRWAHWLGGRGPRIPGPPVTGDQVRNACAAIDEFAARVDDVNRHLDPHGAAHVDALVGVSRSLWSATAESAGVHQRLNDVLAELERIRIAAVLGRPLGEDRPGRA